jgi:hypothetical protein
MRGWCSLSLSLSLTYTHRHTNTNTHKSTVLRGTHILAFILSFALFQMRRFAHIASFKGPDFEVLLTAAAQSTSALNLSPSTSGSQPH